MAVLHSAPKFTLIDGLKDTLSGALGDMLVEAKEEHGELLLTVQRESLEDALRLLRDEHSYQQLMEIAGADYPSRPERFEVVYMLLSLTKNSRIMVKVTASETTPVPTATTLWPNAGWLEREVFDMYGVLFAGNTDLRRILTDYGFEVTNMGLQVHGGHGYIRETGVEQYVRDARITQIYEGANGIQALDLVGRKIPAHTGRYLRSFFHPVQGWIEEQSTNTELQPFVLPISKAFGRLQLATGHIAQAGLRNPDEGGAAASEYLRLFGLVALGYLWARMAQISIEKQGGDGNAFYAAKIVTARFFMERVLPQTGSLFAAIMSGSSTIMEFPDETF